jgi:arginyl-tRNA synthetase
MLLSSLIFVNSLQACGAQESKMKWSGDIKMQSIQEELVRTFTRAVEAAFPDVPDVGIPVVPSSKFGDYQCNAAMQLSQLLKAQGISCTISASFVSNVKL